MAQVRPVTSETLEAQIRDLLPSQNGFSEDLQASNVITPIIDLTAAAQGTNVPEYQAQAIAFGSNTPFKVENETTELINTTGFYRVFGVGTVFYDDVVRENATFSLTDGLSTKNIWQLDCRGGATDNFVSLQYDFVVFLPSGISLTGQSSSTLVNLAGSTRQIADVNGNIVNPSGFTPQ